MLLKGKKKEIVLRLSHALKGVGYWYKLILKKLLS